jgi:uncharacterized protein YcaQ
LDYLWRIGELYIIGRKNFQKIYDLTWRAMPAHDALPQVGEDEHVEWACTSALERLGTATASEIADFWRAVKLPRVREWLGDAVRDGRVVRVQIVSEKGTEKPRSAYALPDVRRMLRRLGEAPPQMRLLCPFDPVLRDRKRLKRLFEFDHTFEGFVPPSKRRFGYYVMPVLRGEKLVGRVDPKFHRDKAVLRIQKVWWEPQIKVDTRLKRELEAACQRLASFLGAERVEIFSNRKSLRGRADGTRSSSAGDQVV